jgi:hypothetical protein
MPLNCYLCRGAGLQEDQHEHTAVSVVPGYGKRRLCKVHRDMAELTIVQGTQWIGDLWAPESGHKNKKKTAPGMGSLKGSAFEREIGADLSMWVSSGTRNDLFARTVLSGGQWTMSSCSPSFVRRGQAGDIGPNHPLAFEFLSKFVLECKHWAFLELDYFIWEKHDLYEAMQKVVYEADCCQKHWMLICRENFRPTLAIFAAPTNPAPLALVKWHGLFAGTVYLVRWQELREKCSANAFLRMYDEFDSFEEVQGACTERRS